MKFFTKKAILLIALLCLLRPLEAQSIHEEFFHIEAEEIIYDPKSLTITARGKVHISQYIPNQQGWRHLYAHEIIYQQKTVLLSNRMSKGYVISKEKLWLKEPNGDFWQVNSLEFDDDFCQGILQKLLLITQDQTRLFAEKGERLDKDHTVFYDASYSPCKTCKVNHCEPTEVKEPLWSLKASKVIRDEEQQKIIYKHARLEFKGFPVLYLPYFSHPDPKIKRKSGMLFPTFGVSENFGFLAALPMYYSIAPNRDLTLTPTITTKQGGIFSGEYRHRFYNGEAMFSGSYTRSHNLPKNTLSSPSYLNPSLPKADRWNITGLTRYDVNHKQRIKLNINRASDTTYITRYPLNRKASPSQNKNLTSSLIFEQFEPNQYFGVRNFLFQTDSPKTSPLVLPLANFDYQAPEEFWGGNLSFEGNFLSLAREKPVLGKQATQMQRLSGKTLWTLPYISQSGHLVTSKASIRGDGYYTRRYQSFHSSSAPYSIEKTAVRIFPQLSLDWRYPLVTTVNYINCILQPMASIIASPIHSSADKIPNEDSTIFELDDTNLFQSNRFNGIDRTDTGYRIVYGFNNTLLFSQQRSISFFLGQSCRLDGRQVVPNAHLGEDHKKSGYIGRLKINPIPFLRAHYRFAFEPYNNKMRYSELGMSIGKPQLKLDIAYVYLNRNATIRKKDLSQVNWHLSSQILESWSVSFAQIKNLKASQSKNSLASYLLAQYKDECFQLNVGLYKTGYRDRDIKPDSGVLVQFVFKNLGTFTPVSAPLYPGSMLTSF